MRIALAISRYRRTGGLERVALEWARGLRDRGHDVIVFTQSVEENDEHIVFVKTKGPQSPGWLRAATFPFAAARAMRRHAFDVACSFGAAVNAPTVMATAGPHRAWFEQGTHEASLFSIEGFRRRINPHHRVVMAMERKIVGGGRYERVLATSRRSADDYARLYHVPPERLGVLENGVNMDEFSIDSAARGRVRDAWEAGDRPVVLSLSNEITRKGVDTLIRAFPRVLQSSPDALLVIAGPVAHVASRLVNEAGLPPASVRVVGSIPEAAGAFNAADVFAFPTRYDPWGLVAIEALACGTPVVCGRTAGVAEHIRDGQTGVLLDEVRSEEALADAIVRGLALRADARVCRASIEQLAWPRVLDRAEKILLDVVRERTGVPA